MDPIWRYKASVIASTEPAEPAAESLSIRQESGGFAEVTVGGQFLHPLRTDLSSRLCSVLNTGRMLLILDASLSQLQKDVRPTSKTSNGV